MYSPMNYFAGDYRQTGCPTRGKVLGAHDMTPALWQHASGRTAP
jgi:hypothetical protein